MSLVIEPPDRAVRKALQIGSVSFLNAKPLIYGLDECEGLDLTLDVPSRLLGGMLSGRFDVALLPVIDYQRMPGLRVLTAGGIGSDGPTLTVRIFSQTPIHLIRTLACDTDSHTSVALARVIFAERYGIRPTLIDLPSQHPTDPPVGLVPGMAQLLIGDKVVTREPRDMPYQVDLGEAWKELTGLPFVFAAWMARGGVELGSLPGQLVAAKQAGLRHVEDIIARHAPERGWPADIARKYLTEYLEFDITPRHLEAIALFHSLAHKHGILEHPARALDVLDCDHAQ